MADVVSAATRSRMMSNIKNKNTGPEMAIRKKLFSQGFRYLKNCTKLPGKPDMVLPKYRAIVFIHGCFWHGHGCSIFKMPSSNRVFWKNKITSNVKRDIRQKKFLSEQGWRIITVWECAIRADKQNHYDNLTKTLIRWLKSSRKNKEIPS